jgi:dihydroorotate dehydrogenase electron transfer subunit
MHLTDATIVRHDPASGGYRRIVFDAPRFSETARPGQFLHLRIPNLRQAALRRPFSICLVEGTSVQVLYKTVGTGTEALARLPAGMTVSLLGPLGNGFPLETGERLPVLVGGGYGVAPLLFLASRLPRRGLVFAGGRTQRDLLLQEEFAALGWEYHASTEDGSAGVRGRVTDALDAWAGAAERPQGELFACGPDGMLKAVGERAVAWNVSAWLSLDKHMGCGVGACLACVQTLRRADGSLHIARVCRDGPVFAAREVVWEGA